VASLVVGIFPESDPAALESALSGQQIDLSKVKVVGAKPDAPESSQLEFVDVIEELDLTERDEDLTQGSGVWDETGTSVPGLGGRQATLADFRHRDHPAKRYFAAFSIPTDEVDNFGDALAEGRAVVLYPDAGSSAETIAQAFRAAGLRNVRSY
jgi:rhodanese-related sulfurtransferase